jgi:hypothetical protein
MKRRLVSKRRLALAATLLTLGIAAVATTAAVGGQERTQPGAAAADPSCDFLILNSAVDGGTQVCVSQHGNVVLYNSPFGFEHINVATIAEGYGVCYDHPFLGTQTAYDHGFTEANWGPPTVTSFSPLTIFRTTTDNLIELRQQFLPNAARHETIVQNRLRNVGRFAVDNVVFWRAVDFDIDNSTFNNHAADDRDAYFAWNDWDENVADNDAHMMSLAQHPGSGAPRLAKITQTFMDTACNAVPQSSPTLDTDDTGRLEYRIGTLNPGVSRTPTVIYNRH